MLCLFAGEFWCYLACITDEKSDTTRSKETITSMKRGPKSGGEEVQLYIVYYRRLLNLECSAFHNIFLFPQWHDIEICFLKTVGSLIFVHSTPNFGKIGAQAATPPSRATYTTKLFYETIIIKLSNDLNFWLLLTASRRRFDNNRSILN